jgi:hypothetical protein
MRLKNLCRHRVDPVHTSNERASGLAFARHMGHDDM